MAQASGRKQGRPKGAKDNSPRPTLDIRRRIMDARERLVDVLAGQGVFYLMQIIAEGPPRWSEDENGKRVLVEGNECFRWAMDFVADRCGMPRRTEADITQPGGFVIKVEGVGGGLGWPGAVVDGGSVGRDGDRPPVAH